MHNTFYTQDNLHIFANANALLQAGKHFLKYQWWLTFLVFGK